MPFKSEKQRRWMHIHKPKMAEEWEREQKAAHKKKKKKPAKKESAQ